jgi:type III pantothenate kinase
MHYYGKPMIVADLGTATTITLIDADGSFRGGAILPGVKLSYRALASGTSLLPDISITPPKKVIATNTVDCMRSGAVFGSAAILDGMIDRMEAELGEACRLVATGGLAKHIVPFCRREIIVDDDLLLKGLWVLWEKNRK